MTMIENSGQTMTGLTEEEVSSRIAQGLTNRTEISTDKTTREIIRGNVLTYFNLIFLIITVCCWCWWDRSAT